MKVFITIEKILESNLGGLGFHFIDCRYRLGDFPYGPAQHEAERPAGSVFVHADGPYMKNLEPEVIATGARHQLPALPSFVSWLYEQGVGKHGPVVIFDDTGCGLPASRLFWQMKIGFDCGFPVFLLDGGWHAYKAAAEKNSEKLKIESGKPTAESRGAWAATERPFDGQLEKQQKQWAHTVSISDIFTCGAKAVFDARPAARFAISPRPITAMDTVSGGIPGAKSWEFPSFLTVPPMTPGAKLKPKEDILAGIQKVFEENGIKSPRHDIVMSCGSGASACMNLAVMAEFLDLQAEQLPKLYAGSFSEYSTLQKQKVVQAHIDHHGFAMFFTAGKNFPDNQDVTPESEIVVNEKKMTVSAALEANAGDAEFKKALLLVKKDEVLDIFTAAGTYKISA